MPIINNQSRKSCHLKIIQNNKRKIHFVQSLHKPLHFFCQTCRMKASSSFSIAPRMFEMALKRHGIVVKYKRIEKLCQRIKLKFKGRGRPPESKIQTNPVSV